MEKAQKSMWNGYPSEASKESRALSRTNGREPFLIKRGRQTCIPVRNILESCPVIFQRRWQSSRKAPSTAKRASWAFRDRWHLGQVRGHMAAHRQRLPWTLDLVVGKRNHKRKLQLHSAKESSINLTSSSCHYCKTENIYLIGMSYIFGFTFPFYISGIQTLRTHCQCTSTRSSSEQWSLLSNPWLSAILIFQGPLLRSLNKSHRKAMCIMYA